MGFCFTACRDRSALWPECEWEREEKSLTTHCQTPSVVYDCMTRYVVDTLCGLQGGGDLEVCARKLGRN